MKRTAMIVILLMAASLTTACTPKDGQACKLPIAPVASVQEQIDVPIHYSVEVVAWDQDCNPVSIPIHITGQGRANGQPAWYVNGAQLLPFEIDRATPWAIDMALTDSKIIHDFSIEVNTVISRQMLQNTDVRTLFCVVRKNGALMSMVENPGSTPFETRAIQREGSYRVVCQVISL